MYRFVVVSCLLVACTDDATLGEVESLGSTMQGSTMQGSTMQGASFQGSTMQGTYYNGSTMQGARYGSSSIASGSISKTTITVWRQLSNGNWEQRKPNTYCLWNSTKTQPIACSTYNLATQASPLAGVTFPSTFRDPATGLVRSATVRIASRIGAVSPDSSMAMHPLNGAGANGTVVPYNGNTCMHPNGCRINSDLWLYEVDLVDKLGTFDFCPNGGKAFALAGTWSANGTFSSSSSSFTFACTNGTIAKCTRWGYRPFGSAQKTNGVSVPLADYHQACARAAMADYCAAGYSFTKDGTLVDIYDYQPHQSYAAGFIPRTQSLIPSATMFQWESSFDKAGATELDFTRYAELGTVDQVCPGKFSLPTAPSPDDLHRPYTRDPSTFDGPWVSIENTGVCSHSEATPGKFLHGECSECTREVWRKIEELHPDHRYCISATGRWDGDCMLLAQAYCTAEFSKMTRHSECTTGTPLPKYGTACTYRVCSANSSCCSSSWTQTCVDTANEVCTGGQEGFQAGFCGSALDPVVTGG